MEPRLKEVIYTPKGPLYVSVDSTGSFLLESEEDRRERLAALHAASAMQYERWVASF